MPRRLKFRIRTVVCIKRRWQIRPLVNGDVGPGHLVGRIAFLKPTVHTVQCFRHTLYRQRTDLVGLCLPQKLVYIGCRDSVPLEAGLEALETEGRQHQQPRNEGHEQPRHKEVVNTPKVSVGSRIVPGPQYLLSVVSVRWQP